MTARTIDDTQDKGDMRTGGCGLCLHARQGTAPEAKICLNGYQCRRCAYDQWIEALEYTYYNGERLVGVA